MLLLTGDVFGARVVIVTAAGGSRVGSFLAVNDDAEIGEFHKISQDFTRLTTEKIYEFSQKNFL